MPWKQEALDGFKGLKKKMVEHDFASRIDDINEWRSKTDTLLSRITDAVGRIEKGLETRSNLPRTYMLALIGALGSIGVAASFFVNSEINNAVNPLTAQVGAIVSRQAERGEIINRLEDSVQKGRDDRIEEQLAVRDRLTKLEIHLDDMRGMTDKDEAAHVAPDVAK